MRVFKKLAAGVVFSVLIFFSVNNVNAQTLPSFPTCSNPTGTVRVSYTSGQHAIVGETSLRVGSDSVYDIQSGNVVQCFCSVDGSGVQTNWWKVSSLEQEEIDTLVKLGWHFVPSGAPWGLDSSVYMAFNSPYSCGLTTTTSSDSQVSGVSTGSVLGLASTGNLPLTLALAGGGVISLLTGLLLKRQKERP